MTERFATTLVTADWQTRPGNLDRCNKAADKLLELVAEYRVSRVVFAGDLKDTYNPLDLRVLAFWRNLIKSVKREGAMPICIMGNHDRSALTHSKYTWFPSLRDAGATTVMDAYCDGYRSEVGQVHCLAFQRNKHDFESGARGLRESFPTNPETDILVFHETISGAKWNNISDVEAGHGYSLKTLAPEKYRYVLGGDIHKHQQLGPNAWYVGSPFPHTWGEANQRKVFAIVTDEGLDFIDTGLPLWHDPDAPEFKPPADWTGSRVRLRKALPSSDPTALQAVATQAQEEYPGAKVIVQPVPREQGDTTPALRSDRTEMQHVADYLDMAAPEALRPKLLAWVERRLAKAGGEVGGPAGTKFLAARARNFLCFETLDVDFDVPGLTVITGENRDRPGKSNGSGKTSLVSTLPVALFGRTFKGQKTDAWARRGVKKASVQVLLETAEGRRLLAVRQRKPASVRLYDATGEENVELSVGGKQRAVSDEIERRCGFSWETFGATVFLSQEEIGAFLFGTPKQRHDLITRLQRLERFEIAWKQARRDWQAAIGDRNMEATNVAMAESSLKTLAALGDTQAKLEEAEKALEKAGEERDEAMRERDRLVPDPDAQANLHLLRSARTKAEADEAAAKALYTSAVHRYREIKNEPTECPTCGQPIKGRYSKSMLVDLRRKGRKLRDKFMQARNARAEAHDAWAEEADAQEDRMAEWRRAQERCQRAKHKWLRAVEWRSSAKEAADSHAAEIAKHTEARKAAEARMKKLNRLAKFLEQGQKLLARNALPAYLSQQMIPALNAAARRFADLLTDGELQVGFDIEEGKVAVRIENPFGGETLADQSAGEARMAALIASLAMREASGAGTGLLVLDEPGTGLDADSQRALAAGLGRLGRSGASVCVITHDTTLAAHLEAARRLHVTKSDGIATVEEL